MPTPRDSTDPVLLISGARKLVSGAREHEFAALHDWIVAKFGARVVDDFDGARCAIDAESLVPRAIVVLQTRSGQFDCAPRDALRAAAPLSPWAVVCGTLSAGETRTGVPIAGARRFTVPEARARLEMWLSGADRVAADVAWTDEDRLLAELPGALHLEGQATLAHQVALHGDRQLVAALGATCQALGYRLAESADDAAHHLWLGPAGARAERAVATLHQQHPAARIIALVGFPLAEDLEALAAAGASSILPLPLAIADLAHELARLSKKADGES